MGRCIIPGLCTVVLVLFLLSVGSQVAATQAHFMLQPAIGQVPLTVFFSDSSGGNPTDWRWDFGDGNTGEGRQIMHTYLQPGIYPVTMMVTDESGATSTSTLPEAVRVESNPFFQAMPEIPQIASSFSADFNVNKRSGAAPLQIQFTDLSSGDPTSWIWDFGDGSSDSVQNPIHVYTRPGTYSIVLSINKEGSTGKKEEKNYITVTQGQAKASMNPGDQTTGEKTSSSESAYSSVTIIPTKTMVSPGLASTQDSVGKTGGISPDGVNALATLPSTDFYAQTLALVAAESGSGNPDQLLVTTNPGRVQHGESFTSEISGSPGEDIYFWVVIPKDIAESENPVVPFLAPNQNDIIRDNPTGPYPVGAFIPSENGFNLSLRSLVPVDPPSQGTAQYGLVRLNQTGNSIAVWDTTATLPGTYFIRAESKISGSSESSVRIAAASIEVT
ncbi:PKD domain-containing protein [Methanospirillum sp.]|uniref:PKD domain-containing protein n=1 Tax=Methanospirillum sp. TaxID=45200 RepID=UPI0026028187|nr:PKD domain-containing protein [Methanospirillum sp.]